MYDTSGPLHRVHHCDAVPSGVRTVCLVMSSQQVNRFLRAQVTLDTKDITQDDVPTLPEATRRQVHNMIVDRLHNMWAKRYSSYLTGQAIERIAKFVKADAAICKELSLDTQKASNRTVLKVRHASFACDAQSQYVPCSSSCSALRVVHYSHWLHANLHCR
jgi:hypothetical protein